ncbi:MULTISPECIES: hypothetical protein [Streptomyces]|uniref:hypothetical protein n=1 Tax=Streptomyces TaxID=1883 RepID=UPI0029D234A3|nr:hypothetical protein [Streptomyces sp. F8]MDX6758625.1 hypothetical protein [Streptomyces sp. F8]
MKVNESDRLEGADRVDFERMLHQALHTPDIRAALNRPDTAITGEQLHALALVAADAIAAEASAEHVLLVRLRAAAALRPERDGGSAEGNGILAALAVITPTLSAAAAVIFLLLGYTCRLFGAQPHFAQTLIGAGWTAATIAVVAALASGSALAMTALRHRAEPHTPLPDAREFTQAQEVWRRALLERGLLPFLWRHLQIPAPAPPEPPRRLGYSSPAFASPDSTGPSPRSPD